MTVLIVIAVVVGILGICYLGGTVLEKSFELLGRIVERTFNLIFGR